MKIMDVNEEIYARMRIFVEHKQKNLSWKYLIQE